MQATSSPEMRLWMRQPISTDSVISARVPRFEHDEENHERLTAAVIW